MHAKRNLPKAPGHIRLDRISPFMGDGIHDADLMLWFMQQMPSRVYARTVRAGEFVYPDLGWAMLEFGDEAVGVIETVWCLPGKTPFQIDERMQIVGTRGSIQIHDTTPNLTFVDHDSVQFPDTTYWPELHGQRVGALREEWAYFLKCVAEGRAPDIVPPEDSRAAVAACLAAEHSAATNQVVRL